MCFWSSSLSSSTAWPKRIFFPLANRSSAASSSSQASKAIFLTLSASTSSAWSRSNSTDLLALGARCVGTEACAMLRSCACSWLLMVSHRRLRALRALLHSCFGPSKKPVRGPGFPPGNSQTVRENPPDQRHVHPHAAARRSSRVGRDRSRDRRPLSHRASGGGERLKSSRGGMEETDGNWDPFQTASVERGARRLWRRETRVPHGRRSIGTRAIRCTIQDQSSIACFSASGA